jgi:hypothetical protein
MTLEQQVHDLEMRLRDSEQRLELLRMRIGNFDGFLDGVARDFAKFDEKLAKLEADQRAVLEAFLEWFDTDQVEGEGGFLSIRTALRKALK